MLWWIGTGLIAAWFILKFVLHQGGWSPLLLLSGITVLIVQYAAYRKTNYQKTSTGK